MQTLEMRGIYSLLFVTENELRFLMLSNSSNQITLKDTGKLQLHKHITQFVCYQ